MWPSVVEVVVDEARPQRGLGGSTLAPTRCIHHASGRRSHTASGCPQLLDVDSPAAVAASQRRELDGEIPDRRQRVACRSVRSGRWQSAKERGGRVKMQQDGVDEPIIPSTYLRPLSSAFPPASALARDRAGWGEPDGGEERRTAANLAAPAPHRRLPPPTSFVRQGLHLGDAHDRFSNPPHVTCSPLALVQPRDVDGDVVMRQLRHVDRNAIPVHGEWDGEERAEQSERKNRVSPPVAADEKRRFRARASLSGPRPRFATRHWSLAPPPWLWPAMPSLPPSALESRELPRLHIVTR